MTEYVSTWALRILLLNLVVIGPLAAGVAMAKRRSEVGHFFAAAIWGPLWLLVLIALPMGGTPCARCCERHDEEAKVCPWCGASVEKPTEV